MGNFKSYQVKDIIIVCNVETQSNCICYIAKKNCQHSTTCKHAFGSLIDHQSQKCNNIQVKEFVIGRKLKPNLENENENYEMSDKK